MSRPFRTFCTASLLTVSLLISGCGTPYTRMYSPRRSYYEKPPQAAEPAGAELLPPTQSAAPGQAPVNLPGGATGPAAPPPSMDAAPAIPGLPQ